MLARPIIHLHKGPQPPRLRVYTAPLNPREFPGPPSGLIVARLEDDNTVFGSVIGPSRLARAPGQEEFLICCFSRVQAV